MPSHVINEYKILFLLIHIFLVPIIKYNKTLNVIEETDHIMHKIMRMMSLFFIYPLLISHVLGYLLTASELTKIELIYLMEIPILMMAAYYFGIILYMTQNKYVQLIESLQSLTILKNYWSHVDKMLFRKFRISLLTLSYLLQSLSILMFAIIHILRPDLRIYTVQAVTGNSMVLINGISVMSCYILSDLMFAFNSVIKRLSKEDVSSEQCIMCRPWMWPKKLCKMHQIK